MPTRPPDRATLPFDLDLISMEAEDGFPLNGLLYTPKGGASVVVVLVHGKTDTFLGGPSRFAPPLLAAEGIAAFALNLRVNSLGYLRVALPFDAFISGERLLNMAGAGRGGPRGGAKGPPP